jgi:hypothetical protein
MVLNAANPPQPTHHQVAPESITAITVSRTTLAEVYLQQQAGKLAWHTLQNVKERGSKQLDDAAVCCRDALHSVQKPGRQTMVFCGNHSPELSEGCS